MTMATKQQPGQVLILALLLMTAIVASTIAISTLISDTGHQSKTIDDYIQASLAADGGLERGLAVVKVGRQANTINQSVCAITPAVQCPGMTTTGAAIENVAVVGASSSPAITVPSLAPDQSVTFDILKYDSNTGGLQTLSDPNDYTLQISTSADDSVGSQAVLDVSWVSLDSNFQPASTGRAFISDGQFYNYDFSPPEKVIQNVPLNNGLTDQTGQKVGTSAPFFGFRVKITAADVPGVTAANKTFGALTIDNANHNLPSRITITSTGAIGQSQAQKVANVLWQLPASPLFNYVLFTENDITPSS